MLLSVWAVLGCRLDLDGPPRVHRPEALVVACAAAFVLGVLAALPLGSALHRHRFVDLLLWAVIGAAAVDFGHAAVMLASSDPTSDDVAAIGIVLFTAPVWLLLLALLSTGWSARRLLTRRRR